LSDILSAASGIRPERMREESFFKVSLMAFSVSILAVLTRSLCGLQVDWTKVTDLVGQRKVLLRAGKAYVPSSQEFSLVAAEFASRLSRGLEVSSLSPCNDDTRSRSPRDSSRRRHYHDSTKILDWSRFSHIYRWVSWPESLRTTLSPLLPMEKLSPPRWYQN